MADDSIVLDLDDLTLGELDTIQDIAGEDAVISMAIGRMTPKALIAVAYVVKRRDNPEFTLDDAKALKFSALKQPERDAVGKANGNGA